VQYGDYTVWQQDYLKGELLQEKIQHWKDHLKGAPSLLKLSTDYPRPKLQSFAGSVEAFILDEELTLKLKTFARKRGATLFMTLLSAWQVLLSRYSHNEKEIVVGTPVANRNHEEIEPLIGLFVNTLPLKTSLAGDPDFNEVLERTKSATLEAYEHQDVPFEALIEAIRPAMDTSYSSLFQVLFVLQTTPVLQLDRMHLPGFEFAPLPSVINNTAKFDLNLGIFEVDGALHGGLEYNTSLFTPETIRSTINAYKNLLAVLPEKSGTNIFSLPLMSRAEIEQTQGAWNRTEKEFSRNKTVHRLFEEQITRTPDAIALECGGERLTYQQLNGRANQLATYLSKAGVKQNQIVGILAERSVEAIVAILAVLKSGAAYLNLSANSSGTGIPLSLCISNSWITLFQPTILLQRLRHHPIFPASTA
jgi:non-ribosomal peptide synthetase component F